MKKLLLLLTLFVTATTFAQIPSNYYDSANGLTGYALKTKLKEIISANYNQQSYNALYNAYQNTHRDENVSSGNIYENDGTVLDFYSENPTNPNSPTPNSPSNDPYNFMFGVNQGGNQQNEGDCYNREHLIPQSSFNSNFPMQSDIHHVIPTDCRVNNFRGSLPFGNVATPNWTSMNGSKRGSSAVPGYSGTMFEPIDEFKGDIARAVLYFVTRYEDNVNNYTSFDMFNGTNDQALHQWAIDVLLDWHYNVDPVDQRERDRNQAAYAFQNNANPFVDHPEYANMIWNPSPDNTPPTAPTNLTASNPTSSTINLSWIAATDNIGVASYDISDGTNTYNTTSTSFTVTGLSPNTNYCFTVKAKDAAGNESPNSNQACETTNNIPSSSGELYISEYVEGSSFNKAIEIANFTGVAVDLSAYSVRKDSNGGGSWDTGVTLSGTLANGDVYILANSGISSSNCYNSSSANFTTSNTPLNFNGNDPIGLFKNGTLIDIIGELGAGSSNEFGENVTLRRNETVTGPSATYFPSQWTELPSNTCDGLGMHSQVLSTDSFSLQNSDVKMYPNPNNTNILYLQTNKDITTTIFNVLGRQMLKSSEKEIDISNLSSGIYMVNLKSNNGSITKKLIKQ